jgi:hypothetical protein
LKEKDVFDHVNTELKELKCKVIKEEKSRNGKRSLEVDILNNLKHLLNILAHAKGGPRFPCLRTQEP